MTPLQIYSNNLSAEFFRFIRFCLLETWVFLYLKTYFTLYVSFILVMRIFVLLFYWEIKILNESHRAIFLRILMPFYQWAYWHRNIHTEQVGSLFNKGHSEILGLLRHTLRSGSLLTQSVLTSNHIIDLWIGFPRQSQNCPASWQCWTFGGLWSVWWANLRSSACASWILE